MAVEDFGGNVLGKKIEVIWLDHQNKPDIAATTARRWFDTESVDMITDLAGSSTALAAIDVARQKNRVAIANSASSSAIVGSNCTPNSILYTIETSAIAKATTVAMLGQGMNSWYFISADNTFGKTLEGDVTELLGKNKGTVAGSVRHPLGTSDFSSFLLQAQTSKARVIALASAGDDLVNLVKSAREFRIGRDGKQTITGLLVLIDVIHALGLEAAQGLSMVTPFYWDQDEESRKFAHRFFARVGKMPSMTHAGNYSSTMHYLKAVKAAGTDNANDVMRTMKTMPVNDFFSKGGKIREDGLHVHDYKLVQVKKPTESKYPWDYYKVLQTIPGADANRPLTESACRLLAKKT
jgi:branched-chain amino acid transport system substrate-binding protein